MWLGKKEIKTAIFWDYENVPIPANNGEKFLEGLKNLIKASTVEFARVFYRKQTMPVKSKEEIQKIQPFSFKETAIKGKNAVDTSLIASCNDITKDPAQNITCILLISGDTHFKSLVIAQQNAFREVVVICNESTFSFQLLARVYGAFSPTFIIDHPADWWQHVEHPDNVKSIYALFREIPDLSYGIDKDTITRLKTLLGHKLEKVRKLAADTVLESLKMNYFRLWDFDTILSLLIGIRTLMNEFWAAEGSNNTRLHNYLKTEILQSIADNEKTAISNLGRSKDRGMYERIIKYLNSPDWGYIETAICALDSLGDERAIEPITKLLKEMQSDRVGTMEKYHIDEAKYRDEMDWLQRKLNSMRERVK